MSMLRTACLSSFASLIAACGASGPPPATAVDARDTASDIAGARALEGPFASFEDICGAPLEGPADAEHERHERCSVSITELADAGPFEAVATYFEGTPFDGNAFLGLKTARGWFVQEIPDGQPFGGGLSHHTPSSASFDPDATRFEDGTLRVVQRGSASSFAPGRGNLGSSSRRWTSVRPCGLRDGAVVCGEPEQVWSQECRVSDAPVEQPDDPDGPGLPRGERTCEEHGTDIR